MLNISKYYVYDEKQNPIAVQIPINDFERIEELIENFGLSKLMDETQAEERLTYESARKYDESLKDEMES